MPWFDQDDMVSIVATPVSWITPQSHCLRISAEERATRLGRHVPKHLVDLSLDECCRGVGLEVSRRRTKVRIMPRCEFRLKLTLNVLYHRAPCTVVQTV